MIITVPGTSGVSPACTAWESRPFCDAECRTPAEGCFVQPTNAHIAQMPRVFQACPGVLPCFENVFSATPSDPCVALPPTGACNWVVVPLPTNSAVKYGLRVNYHVLECQTTWGAPYDGFNNGGCQPPYTTIGFSPGVFSSVNAQICGPIEFGWIGVAGFCPCQGAVDAGCPSISDNYFKGYGYRSLNACTAFSLYEYPGGSLGAPCSLTDVMFTGCLDCAEEIGDSRSNRAIRPDYIVLRNVTPKPVTISLCVAYSCFCYAPDQSFFGQYSCSGPGAVPFSVLNSTWCPLLA